MNETEQSEIEFARRIKQQLDAEIADLDAMTLARLRQAREQALAIARKQPASWQWWPARFPAQFGLATAALVAVVIWQLQLFPVHDLPVVDIEDDLEILIANDEVNFYADMEFLIWLEQQDAG